MNNTKIRCYRTRHIVPFSFSCDSDIKEICSRLEYNADWQINSPCGSEQDIYDYMNHTLLDRDNKGNIGFSFDYIRKGSKGKNLRILWLRGEENTELSITQSGLYLFRSGIGFFWNEFEIKKEGLTAQEFVHLQNKLKEYNHKDNFRSFYEIISDSEKAPSDGYDACPLRRMAMINGTETPMYYGLRRFTLGNYVAKILEDLKCEITFYPERKNCFSTIVGMPRDLFTPFVPDKALLFNYVVIDNADTCDLSKLAFYLTNGYKDSYQMNPEETSHMYCPFGNATWYATKSGCGYYVCSTPENNSFFTEVMPVKIMADYFTLYILLLHQNYTLLKYAGEIEGVLSADSADYLDDKKDFSNILESIKTKINVFLVKSVYASVSHIQHQNGFYEYVKEMLGIQNDIESITIGLESLEELHRSKKTELREREMHKRQNQLSLGMGALSLLAIFSAFADGIGFVDILQTFWVGKSALQMIAYGIVLILILSVSIYASVRFILSLIEIKKND